MNYTEAMKFIQSVSWLGSRPGLERICELLHKLGDPQEQLQFVHVAGTNGKGSTSSLISSVLCEAGYKTGLSTSPHLWRFNERMCINGVAISDEALAEVVTLIAPAALSMENSCTEFEISLVATLVYFARQGCDIVVLEVGLGGRLDATNVIPAPECAVICNIGLDHTEYLGHTVEEIAVEKAGIMKGTPVVSYGQIPSVAAVLKAEAEKVGSTITFADIEAIEPVSDSAEGQVFKLHGKEYSLALLGEHQLKNVSVALLALETLSRRGWNLPQDAINRGIAKARWAARFEIVSQDPLFVVDGGHNPQCVASTAAALQRYFPDRRRVLLIGVLGDKDWSEMLDILAPCADAFVCVEPDSPRAMPASELCAAVSKYGKPSVCRDSIAEGVNETIRLAGTDGVSCSVGSLYMAGEVRAHFGLF